MWWTPIHSSSTDGILHIQHKELHMITEVGIEEVWRCMEGVWGWVLDKHEGSTACCVDRKGQSNWTNTAFLLASFPSKHFQYPLIPELRVMGSAGPCLGLHGGPQRDTQPNSYRHNQEKKFEFPNHLTCMFFDSRRRLENLYLEHANSIQKDPSLEIDPTTFLLWSGSTNNCGAPPYCDDLKDAGEGLTLCYDSWSC